MKASGIIVAYITWEYDHDTLFDLTVMIDLRVSFLICVTEIQWSSCNQTDIFVLIGNKKGSVIK